MRTERKSFFGLFLSGVLYFFNLGENPIKEHLRRMSSRGDAERMAGDWQKVGNDIRRAYEKYKTTNAKAY